jgi:sugar transferase (PEP-CTERM/EpsH1 system associated)
MKLLFLAHRIPYPPNKGDKIRSYHELRALSEHGHEIHLLAFADDANDLDYQVDLARLCASVQIVRLRKLWAKLRALATLLTSLPLTLGYFNSRKMRRLVKRAIEQKGFDAIFVYSSAMAQYIPVDWRSRTIVDFVDVDSEKWHEYAERTSGLHSWLYGVEARRLKKFELEIVAGFANSVLTTRREANLLSDLDEFTRRARVRIIINGVDLDYFQPSVRGSVYPLVTKRSTGSKSRDISTPRLVFTGAMDYFANVQAVQWFVAEILPLIRQHEPQTEFLIVGSNPNNEVKKLAEQPGVRVTGTVKDIRPYLREATACVVPLRIARGVQNKLLEAMACGKAVVATSESAAGLRVTNKEQLLIADSPADFAAAVIEAIRDENLREKLGWQARRFVEAEHNWQPLLLKLIELLENVGQRRTETESTNVRSIMRF